MAGPTLDPEDLEAILEVPGPAWETLEGARILFTGCSGFMGPWLLEPLLEARRRRGLDLQAWVLTRHPGAFREAFPWLAADPRLTLWEGDVRAWEDPGLPFTHVLHGAAGSDPRRSAQDGATVATTIVEGTARILATARRHRSRRVLFLSSGAVHGACPAGRGVGEEEAGAPDPWRPASPYGLAKRVGESLCAEAWREAGLPVTVARCFAFLAPHLPLDAHYAAGNFLADALAGRTVRVLGDGRPVRTYLYGTDLARWLWALFLEGPPGQAVNVGGDEPVTIAELARRIAALAGLSYGVEGAREPGEAPWYVPDLTRAASLGLVPRVGLDEAVARTLRWHRCRRNA